MPRRESVIPSPAKVAKASPVTKQKSPPKPVEKTPLKTDEKPAAKPKEDDTKVEIVKDASGLGLSIVGGGDTPLVRKASKEKAIEFENVAQTPIKTELTHDFYPNRPKLGGKPVI